MAGKVKRSRKSRGYGGEGGGSNAAACINKGIWGCNLGREGPSKGKKGTEELVPGGHHNARARVHGAGMSLSLLPSCPGE